MDDPSPFASFRKRVALFLDGTWNTVNDNTNVWRLKRADRGWLVAVRRSQTGRPGSG